VTPRREPQAQQLLRGHTHVLGRVSASFERERKRRRRHPFLFAFTLSFGCNRLHLFLTRDCTFSHRGLHLFRRRRVHLFLGHYMYPVEVHMPAPLAAPDFQLAEALEAVNQTNLAKIPVTYMAS